MSPEFKESIYVNLVGIGDGMTWEEYFMAQTGQDWTSLTRMSGGHSTMNGYMSRKQHGRLVSAHSAVEAVR